MKEIISVQAYIDPSLVTTLASAIVGVVVVVGAVVGVWWRNAKKKVAKKLNIDENANKEVEEDLIVTKKSDDENKDA